MRRDKKEFDEFKFETEERMKNKEMEWKQ
jgi:hypothetical protein